MIMESKYAPLAKQELFPVLHNKGQVRQNTTQKVEKINHCQFFFNKRNLIRKKG